MSERTDIAFLVEEINGVMRVTHVFMAPEAAKSAKKSGHMVVYCHADILPVAPPKQT